MSENGKIMISNVERSINMKDLYTFKEGLEFITITLIEKVDRLRKEYLQLAVGVYTDDAFEKVYGRPPIKPYEERVRLANSIKGIDWVFKAASSQEEVSERVQPLMDEALRSMPKEYKVGYVPGTYDIFHEGHLQNLLIGKSLCEILIVGVNSDKLVWENKKIYTHDSEVKRVQVIKNLKFVDYVYLVQTNDKRVVNEWAIENVGHPIDVIVLGQDLRGRDHENGEIEIRFTDRDPNFQETHSSTYFRKLLKNFLGELEY